MDIISNPEKGRNLYLHERLNETYILLKIQQDYQFIFIEFLVKVNLESASKSQLRVYAKCLLVERFLTQELRDKKWDPSIVEFDENADVFIMKGGCVDLCTDQEVYERPSCRTAADCNNGNGGNCENNVCVSMPGSCVKKCFDRELSNKENYDLEQSVAAFHAEKDAENKQHRDRFRKQNPQTLKTMYCHATHPCREAENNPPAKGQNLA